MKLELELNRISPKCAEYLGLFLCKRTPATDGEYASNKERTLAAIKQWREADERLEALCKELGIEKPALVC